MGVLSIIMALIGICVAIGGTAWFIWRYIDSVNAYSADANEIKRARSTAFKLVPLCLLVGVVIFALSMSIVQVEAGEVGVVKRWGAVVEGGELRPGVHLVIPFADAIEVYNTKQLTYETSDSPEESEANYTDFSVNTTTREGQMIVLKYTVVFHIDPGMAGCIAQNIGDERDVVERVVKANTRSEARNIPKSFTVAALYGEDPREPDSKNDIYDCQNALFDSLQITFASQGIILDEFLLRKIDFDTDLMDALERKQIASEDAVTAERRVQVTEAEALQRVARANGEAEARLVAARAEAEAVNLMQSQLSKSPIYVDYVMARGIADGTSSIDIAVIPSDSMPLLDFSGILGAATK